MNCTPCAQNGVTSVALYRVHKHGFCRKHYPEACKAEAEDRNRQKAFMIRQTVRAGTNFANGGSPLRATDIAEVTGWIR